MRIQLISLLMIGALAAGCSSHDANETKSGSNDLQFKTVAAGATYSLDGTASVFQTASDVLYSDSVSIVMPEVLGKADVSVLRDSILSMAVDSTGTDVRAVIEASLGKTAASTGFAPRLLTRAEASQAADSVISGFNNVTGRVVYLTPDLLVYRVSTESYTPGAAHGMGTNFYINYDIASGSILTVDKLFTADGLKALPAKIAARAADLAPMIGRTDITALPAANNYMISSGGEIVFVYQPYEVASYAQGSIRIPFYPFELVDMMTPYAVRLFNLEDLND